MFILLITLLPLLMSVFTLMSAISWSLIKQQSLEKNCIESVIRGQQKMQQQLDKLQRLNPQASRLRLQRAAAETAVIAAHAYPPTLPAAKAYRQRVKWQQRLLRSRQKLILLQTKRLAKTEQLNAIHSVKQVGAVVTRTPTYHLNVHPTPIKSDSPSYKTNAGFETLQRSSLAGRLNLSTYLPEIFQPLINKSNPQLKFQCTSTLKKKGFDKWIVTLTKDRW